MTYHYTASGLDNVYLANGYTRHKTPYGDGVSIQNLNGLHKVIGHALITQPIDLIGAELRFLRVEMDLSQKVLADLLGTTEQTLRRWESSRKKAIPGPADRLLRALYGEFIGQDGNLRRMVERLAELDTLSQRASIRLKETRRGWKEECIV